MQPVDWSPLIERLNLAAAPPPVAPPPTSSAWSAALSSLGKGVVPAALAGGALTALPPTTPLGLAILATLGTGLVASEAQDMFLQDVAPDFWARSQMNEAEHPWASMGGRLASGLAGFRPTPLAVPFSAYNALRPATGGGVGPVVANALRSYAMKDLAARIGGGGAFGAGMPLIHGQMPTGPEMLESVLFASLYGVPWGTKRPVTPPSAQTMALERRVPFQGEEAFIDVTPAYRPFRRSQRQLMDVLPTEPPPEPAGGLPMPPTTPEGGWPMLPPTPPAMPLEGNAGYWMRDPRPPTYTGLERPMDRRGMTVEWPREYYPPRRLPMLPPAPASALVGGPLRPAPVTSVLPAAADAGVQSSAGGEQPASDGKQSASSDAETAERQRLALLGPANQRRLAEQELANGGLLVAETPAEGLRVLSKRHVELIKALGLEPDVNRLIDAINHPSQYDVNWGERSVTNHVSGLRAFLDWADETGIPIDDEAFIPAFKQYHEDVKEGGTPAANTHLINVIRAMHRLATDKDATDSVVLKHLKAFKKIKPGKKGQSYQPVKPDVYQKYSMALLRRMAMPTTRGKPISAAQREAAWDTYMHQMLSLLTGARSEDVARFSWSRVKDGNLWTYREAKNKERGGLLITRELPQEVVTLLREYAPEAWENVTKYAHLKSSKKREDLNEYRRLTSVFKKGTQTGPRANALYELIQRNEPQYRLPELVARQHRASSTVGKVEDRRVASEQLGHPATSTATDNYLTGYNPAQFAAVTGIPKYMVRMLRNAQKMARAKGRDVVPPKWEPPPAHTIALTRLEKKSEAETAAKPAVAEPTKPTEAAKPTTGERTKGIGQGMNKTREGGFNVILPEVSKTIVSVARQVLKQTGNLNHAIVSGLQRLKELVGNKFREYSAAAREWLREQLAPNEPPPRTRGIGQADLAGARARRGETGAVFPKGSEGRKTASAKDTPEIRRQIEALAAEGMTAEPIAKKLGMDVKEVRRIRDELGIPHKWKQPKEFAAWVKAHKAEPETKAGGGTGGAKPPGEPPPPRPPGSKPPPQGETPKPPKGEKAKRPKQPKQPTDPNEPRWRKRDRETFVRDGINRMKSEVGDDTDTSSMPGFDSFKNEYETLKNVKGTNPLNLKRAKMTPGEEETAWTNFKDKFNDYWADLVNGVYVKLDKAILPVDASLALLDGGTFEGYLLKHIKHPIDHSYQVGLRLQDELVDEVAKLMKKHKIRYKRGVAIGVYLQAAQEGGVAALNASGYDAARIARLIESLTPQEIEVAKAMRAAYDRLAPLIEGEAKALNPSKPFIFVKDYFPRMRDKLEYERQPDPYIGERLDAATDLNSLNELLNRLGIKYDKSGSKTKQGFLEERVPEAKQPIMVNAFDVFNTSVRDMTHFLSMQRLLREKARLVHTELFAEKYGRMGQKYVMDFLNTVATQSRNAPKSFWLDMFRKNTTIGVIAFRLSSQFVHAANIPLAVMQIDLAAPGQGAKLWWQGLEAAKENQAWLKKYARETFERGGGEPSIYELSTSELTKYGKINKLGFGIMRYIDRLNTQATVLGVYMAELAKQGKNPADFAKLPVDLNAMAKALTSARRAVASPLYKDKPTIISQGGSMMKTLFQFQNVFLDQYSNLRVEGATMGGKRLAEGDPKLLMATAIAAAGMLALESMIKWGASTGVKKSAELARTAVTGEQTVSGKEKDYGELVWHEALKRIPFMGNMMTLASTITRASKGEPTDVRSGIPSLDVGIGMGQKAYDLAKSEPRSRLLSAVQAATPVAEAFSVPGTSQLSEWGQAWLKGGLRSESLGKVANLGGVRDVQSLPFEQRVRLSRQVRAEQPPRSAREREQEQIRGARAQFRRQEEVYNELDKVDQKWLDQMDLVPAGYKGTLTINETPVILTPTEREKYAELIVEATKSAVQKARMQTRLAMLTNEKRTEAWRKIEREEHKRAELRLIRMIRSGVLK